MALMDRCTTAEQAAGTLRSPASPPTTAIPVDGCRAAASNGAAFAPSEESHARPFLPRDPDHTRACVVGLRRRPLGPRLAMGRVRGRLVGPAQGGEEDERP